MLGLEVGFEIHHDVSIYLKSQDVVLAVAHFQKLFQSSECKLYSPEHRRWLTTDYSEAKIIQDPNEKGRLCFTVDGVHINTWFARKYGEQYPRSQVKEQQQSIQMGMKW